MVQFAQTHPSEVLLELSPEETLRDFAKFFREIRPRYEEAVRLQQEYENQVIDIQHYAELHPNLSASKGNKLYQKLTEALRNRRACKVEIELLEPMYQFVMKYGNLPDQFASIQGKTRVAREKIEGRAYRCRTDVLNDMPT